MRRFFEPGILLLAVPFGGLVINGLRDPLAWTAAAALLWLIALWRPIEWRRVPGARLWLFWLIWAGLAYLACDQPLKSVFAFSRWSGLLAFFAMASFHWDEGNRRLWFHGLCLFGLLLGAVALLPLYPSYPHVGLLWPYYNYTIFALAAMFAGVLGALGHPSSPFSRPRRLGLAALMGFAVMVALIARSRSGLWAMGAASLFWGARRLGERRLLLLVLGLCALAAMIPSRYAYHLLKLDKSRSFKRPMIWKTALAVARDHPWLGEGPGNFQQGFMRHNFSSGFTVRYGFFTAHAHSEPLQLAAETGWPGLGLFALALGAPLIRRKGMGSWTQEAAAGALTAMIAQCFVDNMLHLPALGLLFFSALACALPALPLSPGAPKAPPKEPRERRAREWRLFAVGGLLVALGAWIPARRVEAAVERWRSERDPDQRLRWARTAAEIFPADYYGHEMLARNYFSLRPPRIDLALLELERAARLNPTNALYPAMVAEYLALNSRWEEALVFAGRALELEPNYASARLLRAEAWARLGRGAEASAELAEALGRRVAVDRSDRASAYDLIILDFDQDRHERVESLTRTIKK